MRKPFSYTLGLVAVTLVVLIAACGGDEGGDCPGSIISSCVDTCPIDCAANGETEICVGPGFFDNPSFGANERCCFCE